MTQDSSRSRVLAGIARARQSDHRALRHLPGSRKGRHRERAHGQGSARRRYRHPPQADGEGEPGERGGPPGDLYVVVHVHEHPIFIREDTEVICEVPSASPRRRSARPSTCPRWTQGEDEDPLGTQSGKVFRLRGKGIPHLNGYQRGDQHVRVTVEVPEKLTKKEREAARAVRRPGRRGRPPAVEVVLRQGAGAVGRRSRKRKLPGRATASAGVPATSSAARITRTYRVTSAGAPA